MISEKEWKRAVREAESKISAIFPTQVNAQATVAKEMKYCQSYNCIGRGIFYRPVGSDQKVCSPCQAKQDSRAR